MVMNHANAMAQHPAGIGELVSDYGDGFATGNAVTFPFIEPM